MWFEHFEALNKSEIENKYLLTSTFITKIAVIIVDDYEKFFNKLSKKSLSLKKLRKRFSDELKDKIICFDVKKANKLFHHHDANHKINLISEAKSSAKKVYDLARNQASVVKTYVNEMLKKSFIRRNSSNYATSVLIVKKSEENLRICVNYRALNALIIKNRNCPFLIKKTLVRLCAAKFYTKLNVIAAFNEIRIREDDEEKTAFLIKYELYEYVVMFFDFCNALETFQSYINETLRDYLNVFCSVYLNDVFIYSNIRKKHITYVRKIFNKLHVADFYLNINKCEFYVNEIKYFELIITIDGVKMNSKKVQTIFDWKSSQNIKNVQAFLNFVNFYKKFVVDYSKLIQPLTAIIKASEKKFIFSWNLDDFEKKIFLSLKFAFTIAPILQHFDFEKKTWIEFNVFDWMIIAILSQKNANDVLRSVIFMSQKMLSTECNYEIYDKKLLTIIKAFEEWRSKCAETFSNHSIHVLFDHKNLEHFMIIKQLNRRQIKWAEFLSEFNFQITYRSETQNTKSNNLTRRSQDLFADNFDEKKQFNN